MTKSKHPFRLRSCVWEITLACCFSCRYCGSMAGKPRENELSSEECLRVAEQLAELGCRRVSMIGGEVFMRPDWPSIVQHLTERNVAVSIITNGFLFSEKQLDDLKRVGVESVAVSLDGPEQIHDKFRQQGSYRRAMQTIAALRQNGIPVSVISTLHSENVTHLEEMYSALEHTGIFAWQLQACSPMGNAAHGEFSTEIDFSIPIRFVEQYAAEAPFMLGIADNIGYYSESEGRLRGDLSGNGKFTGCSAGLSTVGIDSVGNVRGCESMYADCFIEGSLRERSLQEIWEDPNAFSYNRKFVRSCLTGKCSACAYGSRCAGGCRSYNYFRHGKLYESAGCVHNAQTDDSIA